VLIHLQQALIDHGRSVACGKLILALERKNIATLFERSEASNLFEQRRVCLRQVLVFQRPQYSDIEEGIRIDEFGQDERPGSIGVQIYQSLQDWRAHNILHQHPLQRRLNRGITELIPTPIQQEVLIIYVQPLEFLKENLARGV